MEPRFPFLTREVFDLLIMLVIALGLALAAWRFYQDMTRPLPKKQWDDADDVAFDDTQRSKTPPSPPSGTGEN